MVKGNRKGAAAAVAAAIPATHTPNPSSKDSTQRLELQKTIWAGWNCIEQSIECIDLVREEDEKKKEPGDSKVAGFGEGGAGKGCRAAAAAAGDVVIVDVVVGVVVVAVVAGGAAGAGAGAPPYRYKSVAAPLNLLLVLLPWSAPSVGPAGTRNGNLSVRITLL